jgi:hypothetical protein
MSFVVQNVTHSVVTFILYRAERLTEGSLNQYHAKRETRNSREHVTVAPNSCVDLCEKFGFTAEQLQTQHELTGMLTKGYLQRVIGEAFQEPKPILTVEDVNNYIAENRKNKPNPDVAISSHMDSSSEPEPGKDNPGVSGTEDSLTCGCGRTFTKAKGLQMHKSFCNAS